MTGFDLEKELVRFAQGLRPAGTVSDSVLSIAYKLGTAVWLCVHTGRDSRCAQIDLANDPAKIILYRSGDVDGERQVRLWEDDLLTKKERFSIAHELGHWIAFSKFKIGPQAKKSKYWEQERAINAFAGSLLAPDWLVAKWLRETPVDAPISPFALRNWASSQCRSSEDVVAKALVRQRKTIGFLKLVCMKRRDGKEILKVLCSAAGEAVNLPPDGSYIDDVQFKNLLHAKKAGDATISHLQLCKCAPQNLKISWRRLNSERLEEITWVSLASSSRANVEVNSKSAIQQAQARPLFPEL
jgi:hypothetical protein